MNATKQRLPLPAVLAIIVVGALLAVVAGWFLLVSPKHAEAQRLQHEIDSTQAQIAAYHTQSLAARGRTPIKAMTSATSSP